MPYIIETRYADCPTPRECGECDISRTAVTTLDEARDCAAQAVESAPAAQAVGSATDDRLWSARDAALTLDESGGSIGPLPDGTVIEVTQVCWQWIIGMADDRGIDTDAVHEDGGDLAILAAFNAS